MAQEKDDRSSASAPRKLGVAGEEPGKRMPGTPPGAKDSGNGKSVSMGPTTRRGQYLIGLRPVPGAPVPGAPLPPASLQSMDAVVDYLSRQENIEIVKRVKVTSSQPFSADGASASEVVVARIEESRAETLRLAAPPQIIIESDAFLSYADTLAIPVHLAATDAIVPLRSVGTEIVVRVIGEHDQPLAHATVLIYGPEIPAQAVTDDTGTAHLTLFGGALESVRAICVRPASNHWDRLIPSPRLSGSGVSTIRVRPLAETFANFPNERLLGWGQRLMGLDHSGGHLTGSGVKLGVIDSGCDNSHPQLRHITHGKDLVGRGPESNWTDDMTFHGTHCAGIISAAANSGQGGILGFAPEAEVHVFRVLPGGRVSDLLAALDECIARELDVVNISVGSDQISELVGHKLHEARQKGIACIVAAGNSGGPVRFPAQLPTVLAVGAVGKIREFPSDSSHAYRAIRELVGADGVFAARFSCYGPQIAISAPGVAVVSTVPGGGYAAADGTSIAAAHVSGLAALALAHHPIFQGVLKVRSEQRVAALFGLIRASAVPHFPDLLYGGAGVPDLSRIPSERMVPAALPLLSGADSLAMLLAPLAGGSPQATSPAYWPPTAAQNWHAVMQMRAAGFL